MKRRPMAPPSHATSIDESSRFLAIFPATEAR
jgi:hypothetical protein